MTAGKILGQIGLTKETPNIVGLVHRNFSRDMFILQMVN